MDDSVVLGQGALLARAMWNLVENALQVLRRRARRSSWSWTGAPSWSVIVGPGIDPADLAHVFDRFYRSTSARSLPGSGLGLAIVRDVAESHGGRAFAANRPDGGAEVGFWVPLSRRCRTSGRRPPESQPQAAQGLRARGSHRPGRR